MQFNVERFIALTASMAVGIACAHQAPAQSAAPPAKAVNVVSVPTPEESEPSSGEELVAVVEDDGSDRRAEEGAGDSVDAASEGAPFEEYGMIGALTGGPMLEGGLTGFGVKRIGGGGSGSGLGVGSLSGRGS